MHNRSEAFWILVEDCDQEQLLHSEMFLVNETEARSIQTFSFSVPFITPRPPLYYLKVVSDRWMQAEATLAIKLDKVIMPTRFLPPTKLQEGIANKLVKELLVKEAEEIYQDEGMTEFNSI